MKVTQKKKSGVSLVGEVEVMHPVTGEVLPVAIVQKNIPKDYNFHKIWLQDILHVLDSFGNKKIKVLTYLLSKMRNEDNSITITQTKISKDTGISRPTISATIKELIDSDVIRRDPDIPTLYRFNPSLIVKGGAGKRRALVTMYNYGDDNQEMTIDEERAMVEDIANKIAEREEPLAAIEASIIEEEKPKRERPSFIGLLKGQIGDVDAKEIRREMHEVRANENLD